MRYRRADGILDELVDGRRMLVSPDGAELLTLNETGTVLWDALSEPRSASMLADDFHEEMGIDRDVLEADAAAFLSDLAEASVVVEAREP